jgi:hypothetical protein
MKHLCGCFEPNLFLGLLFNLLARPAQCAKHLTRAHERKVQVQPFYRIYQDQTPLAGRFGEVLHRPSTDIDQQLPLTLNDLRRLQFKLLAQFRQNLVFTLRG